MGVLLKDEEIMDAFCNKKLNNEKEYNSSCKSILDLVYKNEAKAISSDEKELNLVSLLKMIQITHSDIRIYTGNIKNSLVYNNEKIIEALVSWIVSYSHRKLRILARLEGNETEEDIKSSKLIVTLNRLSKEFKSRVFVRSLKNGKGVSKDFNCFISDEMAYKFKFVATGKIIINYNDVNQDMKRLVKIFSRFFIAKSTKVECFEATEMFNILVWVKDKFYDMEETVFTKFKKSLNFETFFTGFEDQDNLKKIISDV